MTVRSQQFLITAVLLSVLVILSMSLTGCRIGLGIGFQLRIGFVYFESTDSMVYGTLRLNGQSIGNLEPYGRVQHLTALDFRHLLELESPHCPEGVCTWLLNPPLTAGEITYLSLPPLTQPEEESEESD